MPDRCERKHVLQPIRRINPNLRYGLSKTSDQGPVREAVPFTYLRLPVRFGTVLYSRNLGQQLARRDIFQIKNPTVAYPFQVSLAMTVAADDLKVLFTVVHPVPILVMDNQLVRCRLATICAAGLKCYSTLVSVGPRSVSGPVMIRPNALTVALQALCPILARTTTKVYPMSGSSQL